MQLQPVDGLNIDLIGNYAHDDPAGTGFKSGVIPALGGDTNPNTFATLNTFGGFLGAEDLFIDRELFDVTAIVDWEIGSGWRLLSTTGYREFDSFEVFDADGTAFNLFVFAEDAQANQWSSDVRVSYDGVEGLDFTLGAGIFIENGSQSVPLGFDVGTLALFFGGFRTDSGVTRAFLTGDQNVINTTLEFAGIPVGVFQEETFINEAKSVF